MKKWILGLFIFLASANLVACGKEDKDKKEIMESIEQVKEDSTIIVEQDKKDESKKALASMLNDIDFNEFANDTSPANMINQMAVKWAWPSKVDGLIEEIEDKDYLSDIEDRLKNPVQDEEGHWKVTLFGDNQEAGRIVCIDDGIVEISLNLQLFDYQPTIGDRQFKVTELMSEDCVDYLKSIFTSFEYIEGSSYIASIGLRDTTTDNRYNIVLSSEFPTKLNGNKGSLTYSVTYYKMGQDIIDYVNGNIEAVEQRRKEDKRNQAQEARLEVSNSAIDLNVFNLSIGNGTEINLKELVDLGNKTDILRYLNKLGRTTYSYRTDKVYEYSDLEELIREPDYKDETITVSGLGEYFVFRVNDNYVAANFRLSGNGKLVSDVRVAGLEVNNTNWKSIVRTLNLENIGFENEEAGYVYRKEDYVIHVDPDGNGDWLSRISVRKE